jgi:hypothetical protein
MFFENINFTILIITAFISIGVGYFWYSPSIFGNRWVREMNLTSEFIDERKKNGSKSSMAKKYLPAMIFSLLTSYVIAALLNSLIVTGIGGLILLALFLWIGFTLPSMVNNVLFGNNSIILLAIDGGYHLVSLIITTFIIGIFG